MYYYVEAIPDAPCVATRASNHNSTRSNHTAPIAGGIDLEVDIAEHSEANEILIFPNPSQGVVNILMNENVFEGLRIVDVNGKECYYSSVEDKQITIDISFLERGMYYIQLTGSNQIITRKFVLVK